MIPETKELSEAYAKRLRELWMMMNDSMSQGHNHTIRVNPEMVDDIRAAEAMIKMLELHREREKALRINLEMAADTIKELEARLKQEVK
jgi:hypothetical protein